MHTCNVPGHPFFSAHGEWIGFFACRGIMRVRRAERRSRWSITQRVFRRSLGRRRHSHFLVRHGLHRASAGARHARVAYRRSAIQLVRFTLRPSSSADARCCLPSRASHSVAVLDLGDVSNGSYRRRAERFLSATSISYLRVHDADGPAVRCRSACRHGEPLRCCRRPESGRQYGGGLCAVRERRSSTSPVRCQHSDGALVWVDRAGHITEQAVAEPLESRASRVCRLRPTTGADGGPIRRRRPLDLSPRWRHRYR